MQFLSNFSSAFKKSSKYQLFFLSVLTAGLSYGLYKGVIDNYLAEAVAMTEFDKGVSEFFRELPGLLLVLDVYKRQPDAVLHRAFCQNGLSSCSEQPFQLLILRKLRV